MKSNTTQLGIVIVNYNGEKYQNDCIKSLYENTYHNFEIIIVDSGSTDKSVRMVKVEYPDVTLLLQKENVGVAKGNNIGIRYCLEKKYKYILLLNNDVVLEHNLIEILMNKMEQNVIAVPKIYYYKPDNVLWYAGGKLDWGIASSRHIGIEEKDRGQYDIERIVSYAPTCCMLLPAKVFNEIGMLDEKYFMYFDDTDLCAALAENGIYKIKYIPSAKMWHKVSSSTGGQGSKLKTYYINRNQLYYIQKYSRYMTKNAIKKVKRKAFFKYLLSFIYKKNNRIIRRAYLDYYTGKMGKIF